MKATPCRIARHRTLTASDEMSRKGMGMTVVVHPDRRVAGIH
jgi:hypothetical protein